MVSVLEIIRLRLEAGEGFEWSCGMDGNNYEAPTLSLYWGGPRAHLLVWFCRVEGDRVMVWGARGVLVFLLACPCFFDDLQGSVDEVCGREEQDGSFWGFSYRE